MSGVVHATDADLADWLFDDATALDRLPADSGRLLKRASEDIDHVVVGWYDKDQDTLVATDSRILDALRDATCAVVEQWLSVGEDNAIDGYPATTQIQAGGASRGGATVSHRPAQLAPRARAILRDVGLTSTRGW